VPAGEFFVLVGDSQLFQLNVKPPVVLDEDVVYAAVDAQAREVAEGFCLSREGGEVVIRAGGVLAEDAVELRKGEWAAFARGYNGTAYKLNRYDQRLAAAYARYAK